MPLTSLIIYWICPVIAVTYILVYSEIMDKLRLRPKKDGFFRDLLTCPVCTGLWVGLAVGIINAAFSWRGSWIDALIQAVAGAMLSVAVWYIIELTQPSDT